MNIPPGGRIALAEGDIVRVLGLLGDLVDLKLFLFESGKFRRAGSDGWRFLDAAARMLDVALDRASGPEEAST